MGLAMLLQKESQVDAFALKCTKVCHCTLLHFVDIAPTDVTKGKNMEIVESVLQLVRQNVAQV